MNAPLLQPAPTTGVHSLNLINVHHWPILWREKLQFKPASHICISAYRTRGTRENFPNVQNFYFCTNTFFTVLINELSWLTNSFTFTYRVIFGSCKIVWAEILIILKENMHFKLLCLIYTSNILSRGITVDIMLKNEWVKAIRKFGSKLVVTS